MYCSASFDPLGRDLEAHVHGGAQRLGLHDGEGEVVALGFALGHVVPAAVLALHVEDEPHALVEHLAEAAVVGHSVGLGEDEDREPVVVHVAAFARDVDEPGGLGVDDHVVEGAAHVGAVGAAVGQVAGGEEGQRAEGDEAEVVAVPVAGGALVAGQPGEAALGGAFGGGGGLPVAVLGAGGGQGHCRGQNRHAESEKRVHCVTYGFRGLVLITIGPSNPAGKESNSRAGSGSKRSPMRILQIYSSPSRGGGTQHVVELTRAMRDRGHEVVLACRPDTPVHEALRIGGEARPLPLRNAFDLRSLRALRDAIRERGIDVVHAHSGRDYPVAWLARAWAGRGALVFTRHVQRVPGRWGHHGWMYRAADRVVFVSPATRNRFLDRLPVAEERAVVIPNWIDLARARGSAEPLGGIETPHAVGVVGSFIPAKGQREFVLAARRVLATRDDTTFLLVGDSPDAKDGYRGELEALAEGHPRIVLLPWQEDLRPVYAALTALAVPSLEEGFSRVLLEAMAAGVPSVVSSGPGPGEIVADDVSGLQVPPGDWEALAEAIGRLLDDAELRGRLAAAAGEVVESYAADRVFDRVEAMYAAVAAG